MPDITTRLGLALADELDDADFPAAVNPTRQRLDDMVAIDDQGLFTDRPPASTARRGFYYYASDIDVQFRCTGTAWAIVTAPSIRYGMDSTGADSFSLVTKGSDQPLYGCEFIAPIAGKWEIRCEGLIKIESATTVGASAWVALPASASSDLYDQQYWAGCTSVRSNTTFDESECTFSRTFTRTLTAMQSIMPVARCITGGSSATARVSHVQTYVKLIEA
ncbi:hypothetical protein [Patulibacter sp. SYSU D01012]|uniref:hypothetical protein n=1 Tax=Patulibacter sp. SYSU D01012 TaxID=2817381 RepID=UPI001B307906|nr:hypothetical protein [Patulibacter sp. SYSU D01012]